MEHVVSHPEEARAKGRRARRDVVNKYSPKVTAMKVVRKISRWAKRGLLKDKKKKKKAQRAKEREREKRTREVTEGGVDTDPLFNTWGMGDPPVDQGGGGGGEGGSYGPVYGENENHPSRAQWPGSLPHHARQEWSGQSEPGPEGDSKASDFGEASLTALGSMHSAGGYDAAVDAALLSGEEGLAMAEELEVNWPSSASNPGTESPPES
jgi:hypothetical protein